MRVSGFSTATAAPARGGSEPRPALDPAATHSGATRPDGTNARPKVTWSREEGPDGPLIWCIYTQAPTSELGISVKC